MIKTSLVGQYAGFLSRAAGLVADVVIIGLVNIISYWVVSAVLYQFTGHSINACPTLQSFNLSIITCIVTSWGMKVFVASFPFLYMVFFWILTGQTLGDYAVGVRVVRTNGRRMRLIPCILRLIGYFICFVSFGIGFFWVLIDDRRQGWHDKLAGTCVIYSWEARQNERFIQKVMKPLTKKQNQETGSV
jgi:uncharacterized RDD family membrane protein YckC